MTKKAKLMLCTPVILPDAEQIEAAEMAVSINPANRPATPKEAGMSVQRLAGLTSAFWPSTGAKLPVYFMESAPADLKADLLGHMNCWYDEARCNVQFVLTSSVGDSVIRVSRQRGGYWSNVGAFNLRIPKNQQTMNLESVTMKTSPAERRRIVGHEAGHAIGWMHEQLRAEIIALLDAAKVIKWARDSQGWDEATARAQMLTPLDPNDTTATPFADLISLMMYHFDGSLTKSGQPILGGNDLSQADKAFAAKVYPKAGDPPPPPPGGGYDLRIATTLGIGDYRVTKVSWSERVDG